MPPKSTKRQRTDLDRRHAQVSGVQDKHAIFTAWVVTQGIEINGVKAANVPGRGMGLVTTKSISKGERIILVTEKAMLQPTAHEIKRLGIGNASPQAQLAACLTNAYAEKSPQYEACRAVWPTEQDFADCMLFSHLCENYRPNKVRFAGTIPYTMQKPLDRLLQDYDRDAELGKYSQLFRPAVRKTYHYHWTIANSRSFHWKPSGSPQGKMVICPFLDYMNHCPNGQGCEVTQSPEGYTLTANRDYGPGEEILATYGAHTNDKLLIHYGFVLPALPSPSPDDGILLDDVILQQMTPSQQETLRDVGYAGNYTLTPATNEICFRTAVAIRSVLLTANEWEHYMGSGEDLAESKDEEVARWLAGPMLHLLKDARDGQFHSFSNFVEQRHVELIPGYKLLNHRWRQILAAVKAWLKMRHVAVPEDEWADDPGHNKEYL